MHVLVHSSPFLTILRGMCSPCWEGTLYLLGSTLFLFHVPPLCPFLSCMVCVRNVRRVTMHAYMSTSPSQLVLMVSLSIPPFRLCGGNLEMLQGRALELGNICQETNTKDRCKRPQAHPLPEEKELDLLARDRELAVSSAPSWLTMGALLHCVGCTGSSSRWCWEVCPRSWLCSDPQTAVSVCWLLPRRPFSTAFRRTEIFPFLTKRR